MAIAVRVRSARRRLGTMLSSSRELVRVVYEDPQHVSVRLTLFGVQGLGESSREWAESVRQARPEATVDELAAALQSRSV